MILVGGNPYMTWEVLKGQLVHFARRPVTAKTAVVRRRITGNCRRKTQCDPELIVSFERTPLCLTLSVICRRLPSMLPISDVSEMAPRNPQHPEVSDVLGARLRAYFRPSVTPAEVPIRHHIGRSSGRGTGSPEAARIIR